MRSARRFLTASARCPEPRGSCSSSRSVWQGSRSLANACYHSCVQPSLHPRGRRGCESNALTLPGGVAREGGRSHRKRREQDPVAGVLLLAPVPEDATYESDQQQAVWAHPRCICLLPTTCDGNRGGYPCLPAPYPWYGAGG